MRYAKGDLSLQQLGHVGLDTNSGIPNAEELIDETSSGDEDDTDEPSTESACGNGGIIVITDNSAHLNVRRVLYWRVTRSWVKI